MKYIEVTFTMEDTSLFRDLLVDTLGNEGPYESFVETKDGLKAYVPVDKYDKHFLEVTVETFPIPLKFTVEEMPDKNWNEEWEKGHQAVLVEYNGGSVWVRAPFHPHRTDVDYELIIEPKMSFGTAHHPTTYMMLSYVAELDMVGKRVLDMGENAATNGVEITLKLGDANALQGEFDVIIANINRNILLADMERYAAVLKARGTLLLSGFYEADEGVLVARANELGMILKSKKNRDGWSALELILNS